MLWLKCRSLSLVLVFQGGSLFVACKELASFYNQSPTQVESTSNKSLKGFFIHTEQFIHNLQFLFDMSKPVMPLRMKQVHVNFIYLLPIMCSWDDVSKKNPLKHKNILSRWIDALLLQLIIHSEGVTSLTEIWTTWENKVWSDAHTHGMFCMFKCTYHYPLASTLLSQVMQSMDTKYPKNISWCLPYGGNHSLIEKLITMRMMCD